MMGCSTPNVVVPDNERFAEHVRNISISMQKAYDASEGRIIFKNTLAGLAAFEGV